MGWLIEFVRREFKDVKTDFKYDVYKYIALGAGGAMLALIYALYQKLRHISVDWFVFAGLFVFSFLIFSLAISASRRRTRDAGVARDRNFATHVTIQYLVWKRLLPGVKLDELFQFQHVDFKRLS